PRVDVGSLRDRLSRLVHSLRDYFCRELAQQCPPCPAKRQPCLRDLLCAVYYSGGLRDHQGDTMATGSLRTSVIGAIFLKETLDAAQNDAEQLVKDRMRMKAEYVQKLESVFMAIDDSGNGMITEERLRDILSRPEADFSHQRV
ncbi:Cacna1i, partial [Symbiodinium sp. KB8]